VKFNHDRFQLLQSRSLESFCAWATPPGFRTRFSRQEFSGHCRAAGAEAVQQSLADGKSADGACPIRESRRKGDVYWHVVKIITRRRSWNFFCTAQPSRSAFRCQRRARGRAEAGESALALEVFLFGSSKSRRAGAGAAHLLRPPSRDETELTSARESLKHTPNEIVAADVGDSGLLRISLAAFVYVWLLRRSAVAAAVRSHRCRPLIFPYLAGASTSQAAGNR